MAEQFLNSTATQLTYHGLCELTSTVQEGELCVFFRNNHFSTMIKFKVKASKEVLNDRGLSHSPALTLMCRCHVNIMNLFLIIFPLKSMEITFTFFIPNLVFVLSHTAHAHLHSVSGASVHIWLPITPQPFPTLPVI